MHITPNNKLASIGTIGLLFLAGIAGMVFLLPFQNAHAATATVTLSTISGLASTAGGPTELTGVTAGAVGGFITITGTGFASNAAITITTTYGTTTTSWFTTPGTITCEGSSSPGYNGIGSANSLYTGVGAGSCLSTTAAGTFKTTVTIPALPGGPQTIVVSDGTNTVSTSFTITPSVSFSKTGSSFGFPEQAIAGSIAVTGFGASETVTITTPMWAQSSYTCTTSAAGSCPSTAVATTIVDQTGGSKTITATGGTSGITASTTFTVKPWVAFYNSPNSQTTFSFLGTAPTSILVEAHGLAATTVAASSITIGGVGTNHASVTPSSGAFYGLVVSPTANVPFGNVAVVIQGTTFSYAVGNIALGQVATSQAIGGTDLQFNYPWGGAMISSIAGISAASTGVVTLDATSYKPGAVTASTSSPAPSQNQIGFFGYGFVTGANSGGGIAIATPSGAAWTGTQCTSYNTPAGCNPIINPSGAGAVAGSGTGTGNIGGGAAGKPDLNGAFFATTGLADTPWSTSAAPTTAASYTATVTQGCTACNPSGASGNSPANVLSPSFGITPWVAAGASTVDYSTSTYQVKAHGFSAGDTITVTLGGASLLSGGSCGPAVNGSCYTTKGQVPDLAAGPQTVLVAGSASAQSVTVSPSTVYDPRIDSSSGGSALSIVSGNAGSTTILRTGTSYGVHGLYANTAYNIVWNGAGVSPIAQGTVIGTFTSTATGGIPVPGVQVTVPADVSGIHNIDLQRASTPGTSFMYANTLEGDWADSDSGLGTYATLTCVSQVTACLHSQFGDMLFNLGTSLIATPTVATVGGSISLSGSGLQGNTVYDLGFTRAAGSPPSTCTGASPPTAISGSFTSTSTGTVPSGTSMTITDTPTATGLEQGTLECIFIQTPANFGTSNTAGTSEFLLQASEQVNSTSAQPGHNLQLTAHGLNANAGYTILFFPYACGTSNTCGTVVGSLLSNGVGAGSATFTVPSTVQTATGAQTVVNGNSYEVTLQESGVPSSNAIASPAFVTIGSVSSTSCTSTNCLTSAGASTTTTLNGQKTIVTSFTNNSNAPVTAIVYAVVHNAAGQTVSYSTATVTANAGATATAYDVLFGLAPGTYTVTIFATSTSGVAISSSSTVTVTV